LKPIDLPEFYKSSLYIALLDLHIVLKDSILKFLKLDGLIESLTGYIESRIELTKLEIKEDIAMGLAKVLLAILIGVVFCLFIILISIAVAHLIAESVGPFGGFAIVAGFYLIMGILVFAFRNVISEMLQDYLMKIMKKKKE
jgi:hypothetical protein